MAEPENIVLREVRSMRREHRAVHESLTRVVEIVGRVNEGISNVRADIASVRADLAKLQGDMILLEGQNYSRHGEIMNSLGRLDPLERLGRELALRATGENAAEAGRSIEEWADHGGTRGTWGQDGG